MSTTSTTGHVLRDERTRIDGALGDHAVERRRDDRVLERDAQLVEPGLRLSGSGRAPDRPARARRRSATRCRRASACGSSCRSNRLRDRSSVGLGELQLGFALADRRDRDLLCGLGLLDLLEQLVVFELGDASGRGSRGRRGGHVTSCSRPAARGDTETVASPIRLPTTVNCSADRLDGSTCPSSTVSGALGRRSCPPPPRRPPAPAAADAPTGAARRLPLRRQRSADAALPLKVPV